MTSPTLDLALELARSLHAPIKQIARLDPALARQLRNAASSIASSVEEGERRAGKERQYFFCAAASSADEVRTALCVAQAWGYVGGSAIARPLTLAGREIALLNRLSWSLETEHTPIPALCPSV